MSNDDKRRRLDGSTERLSVADLIARREAETIEFPRITDDVLDTVPVPHHATNLSGRELHVTELLRREGRAGEEERGGGFSVPKLVAMASGGVVLCGTVAFGASQWLSSPDERPLAEVRFDTRPAARSTESLGADLAGAAKDKPAPESTTSAPETTTEAPATQDAPPPVVNQPQQPQQPQPTTTTQAPPTTTTEAPPPPRDTTTPPSTTTPAPTTTTQAPPPPTTRSVVPTSSVVAQPSSSVLPTTTVSLSTSIEPLGAFDFFAPA
ncbi:hypothetical protein [Actinosynnema sp. NPDC020468]|uniref:hypothetical protein n=1 Tax=Actinosynnema sp. NPDC020468 TaxID=3154488 RepID=UPI0033CD86B4